MLHPNGTTLYVIGGNKYMTINFNFQTGAMAPGSPVMTAPLSLSGLTMTPSGKYAYATGSFNTIARFTMSSSGPTYVGPQFTTGSAPTGIAVHPTGKFLYCANSVSNDVSAFTVDDATGDLTPIGSATPAGTGPGSITIDPTGKFAYAVNNGSNDVSVFSIDQTTGALTLQGTAATGTSPAAITITGNF